MGIDKVFQFRTNKVQYELHLSGKFTIYEGESGTGKTRFVDLLRAMRDNAPVKTNCDLCIKVVEDSDMETRNVLDFLQTYHKTLFVFDEQTIGGVAWARVLSKAMEASDNYFLLFTREQLPMLPYGYDSIWQFSGGPTKYVAKRQYTVPIRSRCTNVDYVVTEDLGNGYTCYLDVAPRTASVIAASGKDNIPGVIKNLRGDTVVCVDLCGTSSSTRRLLEALYDYSVGVLDRRSLEQAILQLSMFSNHRLQYDFDNCILYASEELFYEHVLSDACRALVGVTYNKNDKALCKFFKTGYYTHGDTHIKISSDFETAFAPEFGSHKEIADVSTMSLD